VLATVVVLIVVAVIVVVDSTGGKSSPDHDAGRATAPSPSKPKATAPVLASPDGTAIDASYFAQGACMGYTPTTGNRHTTVFLDAGHGGVDPGGTGTTESGTAISEAKLTLAVELDTMALLRAQGFTVVVSRTEDTTVLRLAPDDVSQGALTLLGAHDDVVARDICANDAKADVLVGIYFDAGGSPSNAGSVTGYDASRPFWKSSRRLATLVQEDVLTSMNAQGWGIPDEGALPDGGLGSLVPADSPGAGLAVKAASYNHVLLLGPAEAGYFGHPSEMPGALIEPLYLTDPFEGTVADSAAGQQAIARGLATAIKQYFAPPKARASSPSTSSTSARSAPASAG
jgi:N-acetylmuramoyl-L-alanine amidase